MKPLQTSVLDTTILSSDLPENVISVFYIPLAHSAISGSYYSVYLLFHYTHTHTQIPQSKTEFLKHLSEFAAGPGPRLTIKF